MKTLYKFIRVPYSQPHMQRWIMMVKDHSTGLVYLCALPQKKAIFFAAKLEKYFGFIGYPKIFHTGVYTVTCMLSQPGGSTGYPAHPRLIRPSVCPSVCLIQFNYSAEIAQAQHIW